MATTRASSSTTPPPPQHHFIFPPLSVTLRTWQPTTPPTHHLLPYLPAPPAYHPSSHITPPTHHTRTPPPDTTHHPTTPPPHHPPHHPTPPPLPQSPCSPPVLELFELQHPPRVYTLHPTGECETSHRHGFVSFEFRLVHSDTTPTPPTAPSMVGVVQERVQGREGPLGAFRSFAEAIQHLDL